MTAQDRTEAFRAEINNPGSVMVQTALQWSCDGCGAKAGALCHNHIHPGPLPGRIVHYARLIDRRRKRS
jgi:hypothetical protein